MTFHSGLQVATACARGQRQLNTQRVKTKKVSVSAARGAWSTIGGFAETIPPLPCSSCVWSLYTNTFRKSAFGRTNSVQ
jgi:hypothetical protein